MTLILLKLKLVTSLVKHQIVRGKSNELRMAIRKSMKINEYYCLILKKRLLESFTNCSSIKES